MGRNQHSKDRLFVTATEVRGRRLVLTAVTSPPCSLLTGTEE